MISPPLSLYVHLPWCARKCPYCDFNSHEITAGQFPEKAYVDAMIRDLEFSAPQCQDREIISIFFGGGTPSLVSANAIGAILDAADANLALANHAEITLEANPGVADCRRFTDYRLAGVNRISIGVQSFDDDKLASLGRIHTGAEAAAAVESATRAGFSNVNLDLMYGLPGQTPGEALSDLEQAIRFDPGHVSWYQLTLEPNTVFYSRPPPLPGDEMIWQMQTGGQDCLARRRYRQYEVSAYCREERECLHNLNYWQFGDYLGIGAGAHGKITDQTREIITRQSRLRVPASYIRHAGSASVIAGHRQLAETDLILEFMLNALRLKDGVSWRCFRERTGLSKDLIHARVESARHDGLLEDTHGMIKPTEKGSRYLDDLLQYFMLEEIVRKSPNVMGYSPHGEAPPESNRARDLF